MTRNTRYDCGFSKARVGTYVFHEVVRAATNGDAQHKIRLRVVPSMRSHEGIELQVVCQKFQGL